MIDPQNLRYSRVAGCDPICIIHAVWSFCRISITNIADFVIGPTRPAHRGTLDNDWTDLILRSLVNQWSVVCSGYGPRATKAGNP